MSDEQPEYIALNTYTDEQLFTWWNGYADDRRRASGNMEQVEMELRRRMAERQATVIAVGGFKAMLVPGVPAADPSVLARLKEHEAIPPLELARGLTPAHDEIIHVPDQWDLRVVKAWASYGEDVAAIVEHGTIRGPERLRIVSIPKAKGG